MHESEFPILQQGIYANHAAISPWPRSAADAVAAFAAENAQDGPERYREWIALERELRERFATLLGAGSARDIALLKNTTGGICAVAYGFRWQPGDNVVLPAGEFPSNRLPWLAQKTRGVETREIETLGVEDPEDALIEAMDERTRVLAVSSVQFSRGLRLDIDRLGAACDSNGVLFFVDAIQHLGALPFDVESARVDCLAASAHKWLLGPEGIAVFYCREAARQKLDLLQVGWHMFDNPWQFDKSDWKPSRTAKRFEAGSPNTLGQVATHASLGLLLDLGMDRVSERVLANTRHLTAALADLPGVEVVSPVKAASQSGIVSFSTAREEARNVYKRLMGGGVRCALRGGNVRLSPHFYQDESVMERLLQHVEDSLKE